MQNGLLVEMGQRISFRRKMLGLTQEQLAERIDVSVQMISNLELGKKAIRPENLINVCRALNVSSDYILTGENDLFCANRLSEEISNLSTDEIKIIEVLVSHFKSKE